MLYTHFPKLRQTGINYSIAKFGFNSSRIGARQGHQYLTTKPATSDAGFGSSYFMTSILSVVLFLSTRFKEALNLLSPSAGLPGNTPKKSWPEIFSLIVLS